EAARRSLDAAGAAADTLGVDRFYRAADSLYAAAEVGDPKWSEPETRRALLAYRRSRLTRDPAAIRKWIGEGIAHANKALALDPNDPDALEMRGTITYFGWIQNIEVDPVKKEALIVSA